ncbi:hypothetical protein GW17_00008960 [Ensete ventricosum]|nr:hypothetical protein GW17_00008960 [Ensete ventricosum]
MGLGSEISPSPTEQETPFYLSQTLHVPHERVVSGFYDETGAEEIASRGLPMVHGLGERTATAGGPRGF